MTEKTVLLYVIADASRTGAPRQVAYLLPGMGDDYDVHIACPEGWLAAEARKAGAEVHLFDNNGSVFAVRKQLEAIYAKVQPRIIHCHGVRGGVAGRLAKWGSARMIYTEHRWTDDFHLPSLLREKIQLAVLKYVGKKTDHTIAVSKAVEHFLVTRGIAPKQKCSVIYGAVPSMAPAPGVAAPIIGTLGRLTWVKGVDTLLRALPTVIERFPECRCRIGGDGPDKEALLALAKDRGVERSIDWLGEVHDPEAFYHSVQVYVHPAVTESFGLAPLEAMSAKVPVVASRAGALPEIITDGQTGLLSTVGDYKNLSDQIIRLLSDQAFRGTIADAGRAFARGFTVNRMLEAHKIVYQKMVDPS